MLKFLKVFTKGSVLEPKRSPTLTVQDNGREVKWPQIAGNALLGVISLLSVSASLEYSSETSVFSEGCLHSESASKGHITSVFRGRQHFD